MSSETWYLYAAYHCCENWDYLANPKQSGLKYEKCSLDMEPVNEAGQSRDPQQAANRVMMPRYTAISNVIGGPPAAFNFS